MGLAASLVIVGLDHRIASAMVVARFAEWAEGEARAMVGRAGICELARWTMRDRSEVVFAVADAIPAVNAISEHLTAELALRTDEWQLFYRYVDLAAIEHLLAIAACQNRGESAGQLQLCCTQIHEKSGAGEVLRGIAKELASFAAGASGYADPKAAARACWDRLQAKSQQPQSAALMTALDRICTEEASAFASRCGGLMTGEQERAVKFVTARIRSRVAELITREQAQTECDETGEERASASAGVGEGAAAAVRRFK